MADRRSIHALVAGIALLAADGASAGPAGFAGQCKRLAAEAQVKVVFQDRPVLRNDRLSVAELKRLSGRPGHPYQVLGITYAEPRAEVRIGVETLAEANGRVCAAPSVLLTLGFSEFTIYLARDLGGECRRRVVDGHEQEHAVVWRDHYRVGARLIEADLRDTLAGPYYFASAAEMQALLRPAVEARIAPLLARLREGVAVRQQQIDSPASYLRTEERLRACP